MPDLAPLIDAYRAAQRAREEASEAEQALRRELRALREQGVSAVELAAALGVTRQRVYQLLG